MHACIALAAHTYAIAPAAIERVMAGPQAGGVGPMGIPPAWLPILARVGFPAAKVRTDRCENIAAGAWIMAFERDRQTIKGPPAGTTASPGPATLPPGVTRVAQRVGVTPACIAGAAHYYRLPVVLLTAILATENGRVGHTSMDRDGSYDMGPAQVNSTWLPQLEAAGITRSAIINNGCLNVAVGAWILGQAMTGADPHRPTQFWTHVGDYNSHTPRWNRHYARLVWQHMTGD